MNRPLGRALPTLAVCAVLLVLLRRAVFAGETLFWRDVSLVWLPQAEVIVRTVAAGCLPLWDAFTGFGRPLLADPRAEVFYPPAWLNLLLPPARFYTVFTALHLLIGGLGAARLARLLGAGNAGAAVAGAGFAAAGPLPSLALTWHHLAGAAWVPWVLYAARLCFAGVPGATAGLALVLALQVFAGSPDYSAFTLLALAPWMAADLRAAARQRDRTRVVRLALGLALGLALAAPQWLPTWAWSRTGGREALTREAAAVWSLHPALLAEAVAPFRFWELPLSPAATSGLLEGREPWLHSLHLGAPLLALAAAGLGVVPGSVALAVVGAAAALFALGPHGPLFSLTLDLLPPLAMLRFPVKAFVLSALAVAVLAGLGLEAIERDERARRRLRHAALGVLAAGLAAELLIELPDAPLIGWLLRSDAQDRLGGLRAGLLLAAASGGLTAAALALRVPIPRRVALGLLAVLAPLVAGRDLYATTSAEIFERQPEALALLDRSGATRLYVQDQIVEPSRRAPGDDAPRLELRAREPGVDRLASAVLGLHLAMNPPSAARWGVPGSFDRDILHFEPPWLLRLNDRLRELEEDPDAHTRLLRAGGVSVAATLTPGPWSQALAPLGRVPTLFVRPLSMWRVPEPLPRESLVAGVRVADDAEAVRVLSSADFDPRRELLLPAGEARAPATGGRVLSAEHLPDRLRVEIEAEASAHLLVVGTWDAGWTARIDGVPAPVLRANVAFRAVPVPAGRHRVELRYWPVGLSPGLALAAAALAALGWRRSTW